MTRKAKTSNFDPRKRYEWDVNDEFSVTGGEINIWNRAINTIMATDEFQRFLVIQSAAVAMQGFLKEAVEEGLIKEAEEKKPDTDLGKVVKAIPKVQETQTEEAETLNGQPKQVSEEVPN